jgi:hypothetical protein
MVWRSGELAGVIQVKSAECRMQNDSRVNAELRRVTGGGYTRINLESAIPTCRDRTLCQFCERLHLSGGK